VWDRSSGLSRGIIGGPSAMIERLASMTPQIRCDARATFVEESGDGVRVRYEAGGGERVVTAAAAVLAVPAPVAAALAPGLPGETAAALREVRYGQYAVGAFLVEGKAPLPWDGLYAVATPGRSFGMAYNIGNVQMQPGAPRPARSSVMVYAAADLGARLLLEDDETIARRFRDDLCAVFPEVTRRIEDVVVQRWPRGIPFAHVGRGRLQAPLTRPLGRLHLVGDYLGTRYVETCAENAEAAALRIREQLTVRHGLR
jgi:oxygen-dependent protoporphyrinogen oxidase